MADDKIQLAGERQIGTYQLNIRQLNNPVVALRIEKVHQRGSAVLIGKGNGVAHARSLIAILLLVGLEQCDIAPQLLVSGVYEDRNQ
jgi:hypothetical protein